jgi:hypothetical protein
VHSYSKACSQTTLWRCCIVIKQTPPSARAGERAVFQPRSALFQECVGEAMRDVLEDALHTHSCLSEGDWVEVQHAGQAFDLRVRELHPEAQVRPTGPALIWVRK